MASEDNIPIVDPTAEPTPGSVSNIFTFSNTLLVVIVAYLLYKIFGRSKPEGKFFFVVDDVGCCIRFIFLSVTSCLIFQKDNNEEVLEKGLPI